MADAYGLSSSSVVRAELILALAIRLTVPMPFPQVSAALHGRQP